MEQVFHLRRSVRLPEFDYSQVGAHFVTICAHEHKCIFGEIANAETRLSLIGQIIHEEWEKTLTIRPEIELGAYAIMPNHFHGIIHIIENDEIIQDDKNINDHSVGAYGHV